MDYYNEGRCRLDTLDLFQLPPILRSSLRAALRLESSTDSHFTIDAKQPAIQPRGFEETKITDYDRKAATGPSSDGLALDVEDTMELPMLV